MPFATQPGAYAIIRAATCLIAPIEEQEYTLRDIIAQEIAERGAVHIPKDTGLFTAHGMKQ